MWDRGVCVFEGERREKGWEQRQAHRHANVCLFLLVIARCIHPSANPAKSVYLGIGSKPVGPQSGGRSEKCESWSGRRGDDLHDPGKGCCYCLSPLSPRKTASAVLHRQDGTKVVNLHPAPLWNFPSRGFNRNTNLIRQCAQRCAEGARITCTHILFFFFQ